MSLFELRHYIEMRLPWYAPLIPVVSVLAGGVAYFIRMEIKRVLKGRGK